MMLGRLRITWEKKWKPYDGITHACGSTLPLDLRKLMSTHGMCAGCQCYCHGDGVNDR